MTNTTYTNTAMVLTDEELNMVNGGTIFGAECANAEAFRAGISMKYCFVTAHEFYIGSTRISKDQAFEIYEKSCKVWKERYAATGDLVGFTREWKQVLKRDYGIDWDGKAGERTFGF